MKKAKGLRLWRKLRQAEKVLADRKKDNARKQEERERETREQSQTRLQRHREWYEATTNAETDNQREERLRKEREKRRKKTLSLQFAGFDYQPNVDLSSYKDLTIGAMDTVCQHCGAKKWKKETPGLCCNNGKISLPEIKAPPPLKDLVKGETSASKTFLKNPRSYNSAFQFTSFSAKQIKQQSGFKGSFKIQGQVYHQMGALQSEKNENAKFAQMYFIKNAHDQTERRCNVIKNLDRAIVADLQAMLHRHNELIHGFKTALEKEDLGDEV